MMNNKEYLEKIYQKYDQNKNSKNNEFYNTEFKTRKLNFSKVAAVFVVMIGLTAGMNYAFPYISNKIAKNPEQYSLGDTEITEEEKVNLMTEEDAKETVKRILEKLSYQEYDLNSLELSKNPRLGEIYWVAKTDKYSIEINAVNGEFVSFSNDGFDDTKIKAEVGKEEAEQALSNIREFLNIPDEYKTAKLERHTITEDTCLWQADLCKEYNGVYNWYQDVRIIFVPEVEKIRMLRFFNYPFDNNEVVLSKEDALKVVMLENNYNTDEDLTVEFAIEQLDYNYTETQNDVINNPMIPADNTQVALETEEDIENYLNSFKSYKASKIVRKVWKVTDLTFGKTEYFVDATTGEIISMGSYGIEPPGIDINDKTYSMVTNQKELYEQAITEEDLGEKLLTLSKNDSIVLFNEKYNGAEVYEFLPAESDSIIAVKRNGNYRLFKFDRYSKESKNTIENILEVYDIISADKISKIEISESNKIINDKEKINLLYGVIANLEEVSKDYYFKDIQQYYIDLNNDGDTYDEEDKSPYTNSKNLKIYTANGTYMHVLFMPTSYYLEAYSKYYKLSEDSYNELLKICE